MRIIGLTGGIGSGKSFVAQVAEKNFSVLHISSDEIARRQMQKGGISYKRVVEEFSGMTDDLLCEDGEINRTALSKLVMNGFTCPIVAMPPRQFPLSISSTFAPVRAAAIAAQTPAGPPPTTAISGV